MKAACRHRRDINRGWLMTDFESADFRAGITLSKSAKPQDLCGFRWFDPLFEFRD
jgi:hypothetical protein